MTIEIQKDVLEAIDVRKYQNSKDDEQLFYQYTSGRISVNLAKLSKADIKKILNWFTNLKESDFKNEKDLKYYRGLQQKIGIFKKIYEDKRKFVPKTLQDIESTFLTYVNDSVIHKNWMYIVRNNELYPYLITSVTYTPALKSRDNYIPAETKIKTVFLGSRGKTYENFTFFNQDLVKSNTLETLLFLKFGLALGTEELYNKYLEHHRIHSEVYCDYGKVYISNDNQTINSEDWGIRDYVPITENLPNQLVLDNGEDAQIISDSESTSFGEYEIPLHLISKVYDLKRYCWCRAYTPFLKRYVFNKNLMENLIISDDDKNIMKAILLNDSKLVDDIIMGKRGGINILLTGAPGTGKTITAEIFSEYLERPLYRINATQLGIGIDKIETNLEKILRTSSRWGAVLLIDEADVYIRSRGNDINQNAIVGCFLRTLEYYSGILFLTSNLDNADDAIVSRCLITLKYSAPTADLAKKLWNVLAKNYGYKLKDVESIVNEFSHFTGRDIKNILRLANITQVKNIDIETLKSLNKYKPTWKESQ